MSGARFVTDIYLFPPLREPISLARIDRVWTVVDIHQTSANVDGPVPFLMQDFNDAPLPWVSFHVSFFANASCRESRDE